MSEPRKKLIDGEYWYPMEEISKIAAERDAAYAVIREFSEVSRWTSEAKEPDDVVWPTFSVAFRKFKAFANTITIKGT